MSRFPSVWAGLGERCPTRKADVTGSGRAALSGGALLPAFEEGERRPLGGTVVSAKGWKVEYTYLPDPAELQKKFVLILSAVRICRLVSLCMRFEQSCVQKCLLN